MLSSTGRWTSATTSRALTNAMAVASRVAPSGVERLDRAKAPTNVAR